MVIHKIACYYKKNYFIKVLSTVFIFRKKNSPVMLIWFHKIPSYQLNKRILWKLYLLYTDYLNLISIRFDSVKMDVKMDVKVNVKVDVKV